MGPLEQDILNAVSSGAQTTGAVFQTITQQVDVSPDSVRGVMSRLVKQKRLRRIERDTYTTEGCMVFSKTTLINLRSALIMVLRMLDGALLEGYGWTPRRSKTDLDNTVYTEGGIG